MNNIKRALTVLASTAVLAPALVACSSEKVVRYNHALGVPLDVKCDAGLVAFTTEDAPQGFYTPTKLGAAAIKQATKEGNPMAALAGPMAQGMAEVALEEACGSDVVYTEPNDDGIISIAPPVPTDVSRGEAGGYKDGIQISVKDVFSYEWIKAGNMFADRVEAGAGYRLIVVDLNVGNSGKAPSTLMGREFQLQDSEGRRFSALGYQMGSEMWIDETRPQDIETYQDINPGSKGTETLVFRVPADAAGLTLVDRTEYTFQF